MLELFYISLMSKVVMESIECPEMQSDEARRSVLGAPNLGICKTTPPRLSIRGQGI